MDFLGRNIVSVHSAMDSTKLTCIVISTRESLREIAIKLASLVLRLKRRSHEVWVRIFFRFRLKVLRSLSAGLQQRRKHVTTMNAHQSITASRDAVSLCSGIESMKSLSPLSYTLPMRCSRSKAAGSVSWTLCTIWSDECLEECQSLYLRDVQQDFETTSRALERWKDICRFLHDLEDSQTDVGPSLSEGASGILQPAPGLHWS